ncbi:MAG: tetratricopeptide repeat protein [Phycisphaeraceae bacterium]|nr:tetratricopeptide repeat protein [Phycisphaeraceae bacterium]MCB9847098.1 tetratricopeptide repeat protein [Phycisphaeraceae bacterium]
MSDARRRTKPLCRIVVVVQAIVLCCAGVPGCEAPAPTGPPKLTARQVQERGVERAETAAQLREQGRTEDALTWFALAIEDNPTLTTAYIGMGQIYQERGNHYEAERRFRVAAQQQPRNFDAQYGHALALQMLNRLTEAVSAYLRALSIAPDDFDANMNLATAYLQLNEPRQALPYARRAVELNGDVGNARVNLGSVYAALEWHNEAVRQYQAAAELMDLTPPLLLNLATSLGKSERYIEMANTLERLVEIEPSAAAWERLGFARFRLRRYEAALEAFHNATAIDPDYFPALNGIGVCLLNKHLLSQRSDMQARRDAVEAFRHSLRVNKNQPKIIDLLSRYD